MNPGPAPRPPTDRQRPPLSLTPTVIGYPGNNNSTASLNSPSLRTVSTLSGSTLAPGLSRTNTFDSITNVSAVKQGFVKIREGGFANIIWKSKWAVLRQSTLEFQKSEGGKISFQVVLAHVTGLARFDQIPLCFELIRAANPSSYPGTPLKDQPQKYLYMKFDRDDDLYEWQDSIYNRCPSISGVSNPTNFSHRVHVGFDAGTGAFLGLPKEWEKLLNNSAITKEDYRKNPQAVIEVLEFWDVQKREQGQGQSFSPTPTPPLQTSSNMQLGHGGAGTSIAPPRPLPPSQNSYTSDRFAATSRSASNSPAPSQRNASGPQAYGQYQSPASGSSAGGQNEKLNMGGDMRRMMEEEARRIKEQQAEKERRLRDDAERERREQERRELQEYNASLPQKKVPLAKQEIGGYTSPAPDPNRYNPTRAAPAAPGSDRSRQQAPSSSRQPAQRPSPPSDSQSSITPPKAPYAQNGSSSREQSPSSRSQQRLEQGRQPGAPRQPGGERTQSPSTRQPTAATNGNVPPTRLPGPTQPKPLNVSKNANEQQRQPAAKAEAAPAVKPAEPRQKEARMSSMSESEVMAKLRKIVTRYDPSDSYVKQKKIGQGASGSVYIAKVRPDASSPVGKSLFRRDGPDSRVAIKTMDLRHQPRKELIVNEIIVMKESLHPNIVNYLDSFLIENDSELWVIMEYMNGGALTDVIENNPVISEDQISAICFEVR